MTQLQTVAKHIVQYGEITRNTAIGMYRITRLAAVAKRLKQLGVPVMAEAIKQGKRVVDYRYTYRQDYLDKIRALKKANELLVAHGWKKAN